MFKRIFAFAFFDLKRLMKTPVVYFLSSGYLLISGFFFFSLVKSFNPFQRVMKEEALSNLNFNSGVIQPLFEAQSVVLLFVIPFVTMRSIAEERQNGSLNLLLTTSITSAEVIISKYISTLVPLLFSVFLGLIFPLTIYFFADPEIGPIITGLIGLIFLTLSISSIGLFLSVNSPSQTIAGVFGLIFGIIWLLFDLPLVSLDSPLILFLRDIALAPRLESFFKGVVTFLDVLFFSGIAVLFLTLSTQSLSIQREE